MSVPSFFPAPSFDAPSTLDFRHLHQLQRQVGEGGGEAKEREVAAQFEALLIQQWLKQARQTLTPSLLDSDQTRLAQSMGDEQMASNLASRGIGLAQMLMDQIRAVRGDGPVTAAPAPVRPGLRTPGQQDASEVRPIHAPDLSALIERLTGGVKTAQRVLSAIRGAPEHIRAFVDQMGAAVKVAAQDSGVPAELILSQAALESGWGRREILREDGSTTHNVFGIKATPSWKGEVVEVMTTEFENGTARKLVQPFRAYGSYAEAFGDYAKLIGQSRRYAEVLQAPNPAEAARRIQEAGYATDPGYADKLVSIMQWFEPASSRPAAAPALRARAGG